MRQAPSVIGRTRELDAIEHFLDATPLPRALLLEAPAGAGKTTLVGAAHAGAERRGSTVLACSPSEGESALPYAAVADLLRPRVDDILEALPRPQRRALASALLLGDESEGVTPHAVAAAVLGAVERLAARGPLLLAVDDVQWMDEASADALTFALRRIEDRPPVRVLVARRRANGADPPPLDLERTFADTLARLVPEAMGEDEIYAVVREREGVVLSPDDLRRVCELSAGNPFHALQLARELAARPTGRGGEVPLPRTLADAVHARLERLPQSTVDALATCAFLAAPSIALLAAALDGTDAWDVLGPAVDDDVVAIDDGTIRFTHPLLAAGARAAMPPSVRRRRHARLAEVAPTIEERAGHLAVSRDPPDEAVAAVLEHGATDAWARGAPAASRDLARDALRFTPQQTDAAILVRRALLATTAIRAAGGPLRAVVEEVTARLPPGPERARVLVELSGTLIPDEERRLHAQVVAEAGDDQTTLTLAWSGLGGAETNAGDWAAGGAAERHALEFAERAAPRAAALAYSHAGVTAMLRAEPDAEALLHRAEALQPLVGRPDSFNSPATGLGMAWMFADRLDEAREILERHAATAEIYGDEQSMADTTYHLAEVEWRAGRWPAARRHAARCVRLVEQDGDVEFAAAIAWIGALVDASRGDERAARPELEHGFCVTAEAGMWLWELLHRWTFGFLELSLGRPEAALVHLDGLPARWERLGIVEHGASHHASDEIEALVLVGREADAERRLAEEAARAERLDRPRLRGVVARGRGMLADRRGEHDEAVAALREAVAIHGAGPLPFDHVRSLLALGAAERRAGRRREARASLEQARALCHELGAAPWAARTEAELSRLGGRRTSGDELTPTEHRVASLVAAGREQPGGGRRAGRLGAGGGSQPDAHLRQARRPLPDGARSAVPGLIRMSGMLPARTIVGRVRERELIAAFLAAEPCPRALVVEAEAGAGKTALLRWAADEVDGAAVLACWPAEAEAALPFAALGDLLRAHVDDVLPQLSRPQRRALAGALFLDDAAPEVSGAHVVGAALLSGVSLLARERPVLLVVDDAQWLDAGSAEVLTWVVRRLPDGLAVRLLAARRVAAGPVGRAAARPGASLSERRVAAPATGATGRRRDPRARTPAPRHGSPGGRCTPCRGAVGREPVLRAGAVARTGSRLAGHASRARRRAGSRGFRPRRPIRWPSARTSRVRRCGAWPRGWEPTTRGRSSHPRSTTT